jgi:hypothetical protein
MTTIATRQMKPGAREVLESARFYHQQTGGVWFRPKGLGRCSFTSRFDSYLQSLIKRGLIERRPTNSGAFGRELTLWEYRITSAGLQFLEQEES